MENENEFAYSADFNKLWDEKYIFKFKDLQPIMQLTFKDVMFISYKDGLKEGMSISENTHLK